jgi:hypothetical protein
LRRTNLCSEISVEAFDLGKPARTVTFANGLVVPERIIGIDDARQRVVYSVLDQPFQHHSASMQALPEEGERCGSIWISDFLPNSLVEIISPLVEDGARVMKQNLESGRTPPP